MNDNAESKALALMAMPFTFTQDNLWNTRRFVDAARKRGYQLNMQMLEIFHEAGLLVPFYRVDNVPDSAQRIEVSADGNYDDRRQAQYAVADGRLRDCDREEYSPNFPYLCPESEKGTPRWWNGYLYSSWQLLDLHRAFGMWRDGQGGRRPGEEDELARYRRRNLALATLAPGYLPAVTGGLRLPPGFDANALRRYRFEFDMVAFLERVGYSPSSLRPDAEELLFAVGRRDPLEGWLQLVRHISSRSWEKLGGEALDCIWARIGAEVLLHAHEDLDERGILEPLPDLSTSTWHHVLHERLGRRTPYAEALEEVLGRFGLSPHPRVLLLVEGQTELDHFPKLLDVFGLNQPELVRVQLGGTRVNPQLLARYAVAPRLGQQRPDGWQLAATPTALVIAMDAENRWSTAAKRTDERRRLQEAIREEVQLQGGDIGQDELDLLVTVQVWGDQKYELANFTNDELLPALAVLARGRDDNDKGTSAWRIRTGVALDAARAERQDIDTVIGPMRIRKPDLAGVLWPALFAKCERELEVDSVSTPILTIVLRVQQLVAQLSGGGFCIAEELLVAWSEVDVETNRRVPPEFFGPAGHHNAVLALNLFTSLIVLALILVARSPDRLDFSYRRPLSAVWSQVACR